MTAASTGRSVSRRALLRLLSVGASPLIAACEGDAPTSSSSKEPVSMGDPVPPAPARRGREGLNDQINSGDPMLVPDPDPRTPFLLDIIGTRTPGYGQLRLEDGKTTTFYEAMEWTRLRSDVSGFIAPSAAPVDEDVTGFVPPVFENDALAVRVVWRFYDRRPNEVIGLYSCRVESHVLDGLRRAIEGIRWAQLPHETGAHYTDYFSSLQYSRGDLLIEQSLWGVWLNDALKPLRERLRNIDRKLSPLATLEIHAKVERISDDSPQYTFHVVLENRGTQPVVFTDPRIPFGDVRAFNPPRFPEGEMEASLRTGSRLLIAVSPSEERFSDLSPQYVPLPPLPADAPRTVILPGGGKFELEIPWTAAEPGSHWLRARWYDFDGPIEPAEGQLPFMSIPDEGPCLIGKGPYPIRGTVFADQPFEVPAQ